MSADNRPDQTKLERLAVLLRDDGVDPETMEVAELAQYLKDQKVEMAGPQKQFAALLKKARARQTLERAHARRLKAIERAKSLLCAGADAAEVVREKVRSMIQNLGQHDPEQAQVYAREFEKATPEDLRVLEEDLTLLELEAAEDEKGDSQNPG